MRLTFLVFAGIFLLSGCASMIGDSNQVVSIDTPNCPAAKCTASNSQGTYFVNETPGTISINKAFSDLTITCQKNGKSATSMHKSSANVATFGNVLLGGIPGALIDGGSGKGYDYQNYLINSLSCK
ncbi:MAG: hypothetical protein ACKVHB_07995 [Pseudomonadales bacterium]